MLRLRSGAAITFRELIHTTSRARLDVREIAPKAGSSHKLMFKYLMALTAAGVSASIYEDKKSRALIPLIPLIDITAIKASFEAMSSELTSKTSDEIAKEKLLDYSRALNESIHNAQLADFKDNLYECSLLSGGLSEEYLQLLVHHLSETGKVSFLKYLSQSLEIEITAPLGKKLLAHPAGEAIEHLVGRQFALGPGNIRLDGAKTYIGMTKHQDTSFAIESVDNSLILNGIDIDADLAAVLSNLKAKRGVASEIDDKYKGVVVLDWENDDELYNYGKALKVIADKKIGESSSLFILAAGHYVYGQVQITNHGNENYTIKTLYMESLGSAEGCNALDNFIAPLMHDFPKGTTNSEHFCPELKVQYSAVGCSVIVLNDFRNMLHYDWTVQKHHPQYKNELPKQGAIWAYMKRQDPQSRTGQFSEQVIPGSWESAENSKYRYFAVEMMPLLFSRQKQSETQLGLQNVWDFDKETELRLDGKEYNGEKRVIFGQMGYQLELQQSPEKRQQEELQGFNPFSDETVAEYRATHLKENARGKKQNHAIEDIYTWTLPLLKHLVDKTPEEIAAMPEEYSLKQFMSKKDVSLKPVGADLSLTMCK